MIGVEWGTTRFRAFRLGRDGSIRDQRSGTKGISQVPDGRFGDTLRDEVGPWLAAGEDRVLLCGPIGGSQGWKEASPVACPAGITELAHGLVDIGFDWARVKLVPGVAGVDDTGMAEMTHGEETQVMGVAPLLREGGLACVPGLHAKWLRLRDGCIVSITTHMTGEIFGALRRHTSLSRTMRDGPANGAPFDAGVARSGEAGGLLHHLFGVRALTQTGRLSEADAPAYLSGILVGHEVRAALASNARIVVQLVGPTELTALYAKAITACGGFAERHDGEAVARGLGLIGAQASWT